MVETATVRSFAAIIECGVKTPWAQFRGDVVSTAPCVLVDEHQRALDQERKREEMPNLTA